VSNNEILKGGDVRTGLDFLRLNLVSLLKKKESG